MWRKHRAGDLTANDARLLVADFEADYRGSRDASPRFATVRMTDDVVVVAGRLVARDPLRAGDAVQLASAVVARRADAAIDRLAAFDVRLRDAAATEGFTLLPSGVARER